MKENKILSGKDANSEEEKSNLEQIEEEVKNSIFSVFYLLLKNNETSYWKFVIMLLIEYIQLLSFSFDESMSNEWGAKDVVSYFAQFLSTFRIVYWLERLTWDVYIIIFYICVFLVFVVIIDFLYVSISFRHKKLSFTQPIQILKIACSLTVTILFIPIVQFFLSLSACEGDPNSVNLIHVVYPAVICFQSIHVVHIAMSYVLLLLFGLITFITTILNFENRYTRDPTSKVNAKTDLFVLLSKAIYVFFFTFFSQQQYALFKSIILVVFSVLSFISYLYNRPYYNQTTQTVVEVFSGIFAWTNIVLLFTQVISGAKFTGSLEILFLGIPIIIVLIYTKQEDRNKLLMTAETQFERAEFCQKKNFYYIFIIETKEVIRQSAIILKGYVNHHVVVCPYDTCPIKAFKKLMEKEKLTSETARKKKIASSGNLSLVHSENNQLLLSQGKALYMNGIRKFPKYMPLRIDFANFLQSRMRDRKGALNELSQAEKCKPGFEHQFMIFRQRKIIEDELAEGQEHGGMDFIAALNFENMFKQFKTLIEKSSMLHFEFWNHLQDDSPDLVRLSLQGAKINTSILAVEDHWKKLSRMSSNAPKALKLYASYLIEVLNDKETGNEQMIKAKEAANLRVNFEFNSAAAVNQDSDVNSYAQDGTPCIYISGETERLGIVNQCNMSLCKIFGYLKKEDIVSKNIKVLQPKIFSDHHDELLSTSIQKAADLISSRERQIFGKHFSGYIFPLWLQIKNLPSLLSGRQFVATFKVEKTGVNKCAAYVLFNKDRELMDISPSCLQLLGISQDSLHKKQIYYDVPSLFPQLFLDGQPSSQYMNKAGSQLTYCFPRVIEYQHQQENIEQHNNRRRGSNNRQLNDDTSAGGDDDQIKRSGTNGENTQDGQNEIMDDKTSMNDDTNNNGQENGDQERSYSLSQQKSVKSSKNGATKKTPGGDDDNEDEIDGTYQKYLFKAIGTERQIYYHANLTEIYYELINLTGGYFLRIETTTSQNQQNAQALAAQVQKKVLQQTFQFSYDPIFKRFNRELRDQDNRDFLVDKFYLDLKLKKEQSKLEVPLDPNIHRYANMSYINFLNRNQRMIERGALVDDFDDDEEGQSEDDSNMSGSPTNEKSKSKAAKLTEMVGDTKKQQLEKSEIAKMQAQQALMSGPTGPMDYNKMLVVGEGFGREFLKSEIERLIRVLQEKQSAGSSVHTFIRSEGSRKGWEEDNNQKAGLFSDRGGDIEKVEGEGEEEESQGKESSDKSGDGDSLKANIKSKKAFSMAINDKTMPPAIKKLSTTAQIILVILIAIAITEYAIIYKQFADTKSNFTLIEKAYERTAELQKVVYNARSMILMSSGMLTTYAGFATRDEFVAAIKAEFSASLDLIYKIQNEINLSQLPVSDAHDQLLNNKTVTLFFKEDLNSMKALSFSLTESILQISSTIFTISNMRLQDFTEANEDVFFLMYNSFNEFYIGLLKSSEFYVNELNDRSSEREEISLILYILSILALVICFLILIPVVHSVNQQKDKVLSLFCEIDNSVIRILATRCEKFINSLQQEEGNDEIDSNEEMDGALPAEDDADEYNLLSGTGKRIKKAKGKTKTDKQFFFQFFIALCCIHAYYLQNFLLNTDAVSAAQVLSKELNVTAVTEPFYWFALNTQREMLYNQNRVITNKPSITISMQNIYQLYEQQNYLQESHLDHKASLNVDYWDKFEQVMRQDLCPQITYFKNTTTGCDKFISGSLSQGLHVVVIRYFETLRNQLNMYQNFTQYKNDTGIKQMFNNNAYYELYVIQNFVSQKYIRDLVTTLSTSIQEEFSFRTERKIAIFIVFLIVVLISFIVFWLPFLNGLNFQIYKTKLMLMIIPLEVLMKIKNVGKVLQSQSFITQTQKKSSSSTRKTSESA